MFAALPTAIPEPETVPGVQVFLSRADFHRLISVLRDVESLCHIAFSTRQELLTFPQPLHTAHNVEKLREVLEANERAVSVPAKLDSAWTRPPGGVVYPNQTYVVRREIGQYDKFAPVAKWNWTVHDYVEMTGAEFRKYDIPEPSETVITFTRSRIQLLDENGKILRERFGY